MHPEALVLVLNMKGFEQGRNQVELLLEKSPKALVASATQLFYQEFVEGMVIRVATMKGELPYKSSNRRRTTKRMPAVNVKDIYSQKDARQFDHENPFDQELNVMKDGKFYGENMEMDAFFAQNQASTSTEFESLSWFENLKSVLDGIQQKKGGEHIGGVTTSMLYLGTKYTGSSMHLEDFFLGSINYSLKGSANKYWLFLHARDIIELERLYQNKMETLQTVMSSNCSRIMLHKNLYVYTNLLKKHNIPFDTVCQKETQMVVTFSESVHQVINSGNNLAIAKNWAYPGWQYQARSIPRCLCPFTTEGWRWLWEALYGCEAAMKAVVSIKKVPDTISWELAAKLQLSQQDGTCSSEMRASC